MESGKVTYQLQPDQLTLLWRIGRIKETSLTFPASYDHVYCSAALGEGDTLNLRVAHILKVIRTLDEALTLPQTVNPFAPETDPHAAGNVSSSDPLASATG